MTIFRTAIKRATYAEALARPGDMSQRVKDFPVGSSLHRLPLKFVGRGEVKKEIEGSYGTLGKRILLTAQNTAMHFQ
jgi:hypothetical protein